MHCMLRHVVTRQLLEGFAVLPAHRATEHHCLEGSPADTAPFTAAPDVSTWSLPASRRTQSSAPLGLSPTRPEIARTGPEE